MKHTCIFLAIGLFVVSNSSSALAANSAQAFPQNQEPAVDSLLVRPERETHFELGAVIDFSGSTPNDKGWPVRAVTPGAAASRAGLQVGDLLLRINSVSLRERPSADQFKEALNAGEGGLSLEVMRNGERLVLAGPADVIASRGFGLSSEPPKAGSTCARISQDMEPPISQLVFELGVHEIDSRIPGPGDQTVWRLSPGRHVIKVSENIPDRFFTGQQNLTRSRQIIRRNDFKLWEIEVEPGMHYRIGARLNKDRRTDIEGGSYWEPVVWRAFANSCK